LYWEKRKARKINKQKGNDSSMGCWPMEINEKRQENKKAYMQGYGCAASKARNQSKKETKEKEGERTQLFNIQDKKPKK